MELCEPETLCIFDHHHGGIWNIDADFYDCRGDENLDFASGESIHDLLFLLGLHLAVESFDPDGCVKTLPDLLAVFRDILAGDFLIGLDHRADNIDLMSVRDLFFHEAVGGLPVGGPDYTVTDGKPVPGHIVKYGNVQIPVEDHRQCAGNRRGTHDEHIRRIALSGKRHALSDTEAVLFVRNDETEIRICHGLLDERVRADDHHCLP